MGEYTWVPFRYELASYKPVSTIQSLSYGPISQELVASEQLPIS